MAQVTIPDELAQRIRAHVETHGDDVASFTARALNELLAIDEDPMLQAEIIEKTREGMSDAQAGRLTELRDGMRGLANELGLRFDR